MQWSRTEQTEENRSELTIEKKIEKNDIEEIRREENRGKTK